MFRINSLYPLFLCLLLSGCHPISEASLPSPSKVEGSQEVPSPSSKPSSIPPSATPSTSQLPVLHFSDCQVLDAPQIPAHTPVSCHGQLSVSGTTVKDAKDQVFQLRGISSHCLQAYPDYLNPIIFTSLRDDFHCNAIRLALYADTNARYIQYQEKYTAILQQAIEAATQCGLYVVIDWHILEDKDPRLHEKDALTFFDYFSKRYQNYPNILYEICNEPNGDAVRWSSHIKPYAEKVIPVIRQNAPHALIIIGTPHWCQSPLSVCDAPLEGSNLLFAFHFYAASHGSILRNQLETALRDKELPILVSEFGTSEASGDGTVDAKQTEQWLSLLNTYQIGFFNWSLCDKEESSALLLPGTPYDQPISDASLTESGKLIKEILLRYPNTCP